MVALGNISGWQPSDGPVTTWMASPAAREAARAARRSDLPPTYQRAQHLRKAYNGKAAGRQLPRLMVVAWDIPGVCDIPAMTAAINAHVRRHDAYHDWFEFDDGVFVRRMIDDPEVIDFVPVDFGHMNAEEVRTHALTTTPETLEWDCFTFGIVQHDRLFHVLRQRRPSPHRRHLRRTDLLRHSLDVPPPDDRRGPRRAEHACAGQKLSRFRRAPARHAGRFDRVVPRDQGLDRFRCTTRTATGRASRCRSATRRVTTKAAL